MSKVIITLIVVVLFWSIVFCIAIFNPKIGKMIIDNRKHYVLWYIGTEDGAMIRKYIILI